MHDLAWWALTLEGMILDEVIDIDEVREDYRKYFGDDDPIGKQLTIRKNDEIIKQFLIGAVVEKIPMNSSFQFYIIAQYENLLDCYGQKEFDWHTDIRPVLYLKLNEASTSNDVEEVLHQYIVPFYPFYSFF